MVSKLTKWGRKRGSTTLKYGRAFVIKAKGGSPKREFGYRPGRPT